jgi:hypothetical protein
MAYCAERDEEFVSTMFEYYKAPYFTELLLQHFLVTDEYRNRWHTKLHPNTNSGCGRFNYYRLFTIMMIPLSFWKTKALKPFKQAF